MLIIVILIVVALLTFVETRTIRFGADIPVSNTILMFILININLLLLILLIFLVFRNLVKLLYDRRRKVMGAKLRTRLVVAFLVLTIVPTGVLFFFSINFITTSLEFWFNVPVEQALENSLRVGSRLSPRPSKSWGSRRVDISVLVPFRSWERPMSSSAATGSTHSRARRASAGSSP